MSSKKTDTKVASKTKGARASNASRVNKIKQAQKEAVRMKFKASNYVSQLENSYKEYEAMLKELEVARLKKKQTRGDRVAILELNAQIDLVKIRIDIIKGKIDLNLRRLKFCLPELKAIELSDPTGDNPFDAFARAVTAMQEDTE